MANPKRIGGAIQFGGIDLGFNMKVVHNNFPRLAGDIVRETDRVSEETAERIAATWRNNIRSEGLIKSGRYLNSIKVRRIGVNNYRAETDINDPPYPFFLEYGTVHIRPYQVATKAAREHVTEWRKDLSDIGRRLK